MDTSWPVPAPAEIEAQRPNDVPLGARCGVHDTVDAAFLCIVCGTYGCMDCVFASGDRGTTCRSCASRGLEESVPWERRAQLGWMKAFWQTTMLVSREPKRFFATPATESGMMGPISYALIAYTLGGALLLFSVGLMFLVGSAGALIAGQKEIGAVFGVYGGCFSVGAIPFALLGYPLQGLMQVLLATACSHGTLALLKVKTLPFEQSLRAICYANAPYFWMFVPCCGWYGSWLWVWVAEAIALRETHRTTTDRAVLAVVGYRMVFMMLIAALYALMLGAMFAMGTGQRGAFGR